MKRKAILKVPPKSAHRDGLILTTQSLEDILFFDAYREKQYIGRYCINRETGEYCCWYADSGEWKERKLQSFLGFEVIYGCVNLNEQAKFDTVEDKEQAVHMLYGKDAKQSNKNDLFWDIEIMEQGSQSAKRKRKEQRRLGRIKRLMDRLPELPGDFEDWLFCQAGEGREYIFKKDRECVCTACRKTFPAQRLLKEDGKRAKHGEDAVCPACGQAVQVKTRNKRIEVRTYAVILQNCDDELAVARHFDAWLSWTPERKRIRISESVRLMLYRDHPKHYTCELYYNQCSADYDAAYFDRGNPANKQIRAGYLYPEGVEEALTGTAYVGWGRIFSQMAKKGVRLNYNRCMATGSKKSVIAMVEYLFKGNFTKLLKETADDMSYWTGDYTGPLHPSGETIGEVFGIRDRQKINRIRDCNGGENILKWMRWSDETGTKIPEETLQWLSEESIGEVYVHFVLDRMSLTQIMNYVKKQQQTSYRQKTAKSVLSQWEDYLRMCEQEQKDVKDEMVYRPRELKRRHNEIMEEIQRKQMIKQMNMDREKAREQAARMREKFPGAEEILEEIREKYEYQNDEYMVIVPKELTQIAAEGMALHHCVGSTDRYYDRIRNRETYICFLRKKIEPEVPFYTLEVEPGGTIRQHRGYLDEEPEIEKIRPFLREWQRAVKRRMTEEDRRYAAYSAVKRQQNIEELKAKNNKRVLDGLMEDFMEAM